MTRDEILDAAAQIFRRKGYYAASMQDIANAVHLQKSSLYHHVSSKQEILLALLDRALTLLIDRLEPITESDLSPEEKLRAMMLAYLQTLTEYRDLSAVLLLEHRSLKPALHARHVPFRDRFESLWRKTIDEGIEQGVFRCEDGRTAARILLGAMNWTITWYRPDGPRSIESIAAQMASLFMHGLIKECAE